MDQNEKAGENKSANYLEYFKALSIFLSSVVIALFGTFITAQYNLNQIQINRNKELSVIIPKLASQDKTEKLQAIYTMSLYGKSSLLPLISIWGTSPDYTINLAISNSIVAIGESAIPTLLNVYQNIWEDNQTREWVLVTLFKLKYKGSNELIRNAFQDASTPYVIKCASVLGAGFLRYSEFAPTLKQFIETFKSDTIHYKIVKNSVWALSFFSDSLIIKDIESAATFPDSRIQVEAVTGIARLGSSVAGEVLSKYINEFPEGSLKDDAAYYMKMLNVNK